MYLFLFLLLTLHGCYFDQLPSLKERSNLNVTSKLDKSNINNKKYDYCTGMYVAGLIKCYTSLNQICLILNIQHGHRLYCREKSATAEVTN